MDRRPSRSPAQGIDPMARHTPTTMDLQRDGDRADRDHYSSIALAVGIAWCDLLDLYGLIAVTGLRIGEALGLNDRDVNAVNATLWEYIGKSHRGSRTGFTARRGRHPERPSPCRCANPGRLVPFSHSGPSTAQHFRAMPCRRSAGNPPIRLAVKVLCSAVALNQITQRETRCDSSIQGPKLSAYRQLLGGVRFRQENAPFHGALSDPG